MPSINNLEERVKRLEEISLALEKKVDNLLRLQQEEVGYREKIKKIFLKCWEISHR